MEPNRSISKCMLWTISNHSGSFKQSGGWRRKSLGSIKRVMFVKDAD